MAGKNPFYHPNHDTERQGMTKERIAELRKKGWHIDGAHEVQAAIKECLDEIERLNRRTVSTAMVELVDARRKIERLEAENAKLKVEWSVEVDNYDRWMRDVLTDFQIPFDDHKTGRRIALTQWMRYRNAKIDRLEELEHEHVRLQKELDGHAFEVSRPMLLAKIEQLQASLKTNGKD